MKKLVLLLALILSASCSSPQPAPAVDPQVAAWQQRAQGITIIRDDWGIPHVYGKTDADAVFGVIYAQAEDDFNRVETNFLNSMGRLAEAEGEAEIWRDLRMKLFIDPDDLKAKYADQPRLAEEADGRLGRRPELLPRTPIPDVKPRVITQFEPWMALTFSEGSIGGDIERVSLTPARGVLRRRGEAAGAPSCDDPRGDDARRSRPARTASPSRRREPRAARRCCWINPHTSFFFRAEAQMVSEEGLNAYGAITWGQFFIYQGFNETRRLDAHLERRRQHRRVPRDGGEEGRRRLLSLRRRRAADDDEDASSCRTRRPPAWRSASSRSIARTTARSSARWTASGWRAADGGAGQGAHAVVLAHQGEEPTRSSARRWTCTRTRRTTRVFADADGNIAYFHANFVPKRDPKFDWTKPVDGSNPATEWQGVHSVDESPNVFNPPNGWIQNTNNWPYSVGGPAQPEGEGLSGVHGSQRREPARRARDARAARTPKDFTLDTLRDAAFDS